MARNHKRLNKRVWAHVRLRTFRRDNYRCVKCGSAGRLECDHIKPLANGGEPYKDSNLQALCRGCHIEKTRVERGVGEVGGIVLERDAWHKRVASLQGKPYFNNHKI